MSDDRNFGEYRRGVWIRTKREAEEKRDGAKPLDETIIELRLQGREQSKEYQAIVACFSAAAVEKIWQDYLASRTQDDKPPHDAA